MRDFPDLPPYPVPARSSGEVSPSLGLLVVTKIFLLLLLFVEFTLSVVADRGHRRHGGAGQAVDVGDEPGGGHYSFTVCVDVSIREKPLFGLE